ncbi:MAG: MerR family transcriptional regulator [Candidatus Marinimicrobia bacterium]|nr:MerR family transcriptional regulator [Candidatus Neomarinimicrobiota bacterium]MBL7023032.1 MerR family transcriptional regulator [Candidatus Neomarinimicrobiota bacterium]
METKKLYYSIGEVSKMAELKQYVLRYWETEFSMLHPSKNRAGNRIYREKDINLIKEIKHLLYDKKFTIEGARQYFKSKSRDEDGIAKSDSSSSLDSITQINASSVDIKTLRDLKTGLDDLLHLIQNYKKTS